MLDRLNHLEVEFASEKEKNRLQEIEISQLKIDSPSSGTMAKLNRDKVGAGGRAVLWPRSCRDLAGNGQSIDGIYLIEWPESNFKRIGAVHCEFVPGSPAGIKFSKMNN